NAFPLPRAVLADRYDFSFSGLKTAVLRLVRELEAKGPVPVADVAASFQKAITDVLAEKTARAAAEHAVETVLLGGGVAADLALRILNAASGTETVRAALKDVKAGRALLRFTDIGRAIEFQAGDGKLHAEAADTKGPGPKIDATSETWLGLLGGTLRPWLAF